jgi:hypothetical protein
MANVRQYYDDNTARLERYGQAKSSIHRAVWGPGVTTREAGFHFVDDLILSELSKFEGTRTVLGLGATLVYLASRNRLVGEGITISPVQAARATDLVKASALATACAAARGTFWRSPATYGTFTLRSRSRRSCTVQTPRVLPRGGTRAATGWKTRHL